MCARFVGIVFVCFTHNDTVSIDTLFVLRCARCACLFETVGCAFNVCVLFLLRRNVCVVR